MINVNTKKVMCFASQDTLRDLGIPDEAILNILTTIRLL